MALPAIQTGGIFIAPNGDTVDLLVGMPVVVIGGMVVRARASSWVHSRVSGIVIGGQSPTTIAGAQPTLGARVRTVGMTALEAVQWDVVTGGTGGLVEGADYYLSDMPGMLTTTPPVAAGSYVVPLGRALSSLLLSMDRTISILL